jgi:hypothetical protein
MPRYHVDLFFVRSQQVDKKRPQPAVLERLRDEPIARTVTAAAASVSEKNNTTRCFGNGERALEVYTASAYPHLLFYACYIGSACH